MEAPSESPIANTSNASYLWRRAPRLPAYTAMVLLVAGARVWMLVAAAVLLANVLIWAWPGGH